VYKTQVKTGMFDHIKLIGIMWVQWSASITAWDVFAW